jgi:hypothetical protein
MDEAYVQRQGRLQAGVLTCLHYEMCIVKNRFAARITGLLGENMSMVTYVNNTQETDPER